MSKSKVGKIAFGPGGCMSLDSVARRHVEAGATAQETFGETGLYGKYTPVEVAAVPAANDNDKRNAYITTYTGRFYPFNPKPEDVHIEDIAHSLAMQCRYAGHGKRFYSVAEHSVHLARWCMKFGAHTALTALLHDATEAYLVDVPRPVKAHLAGYKDAEAAIWNAIGIKFDLDIELPTVMHVADGRICADEMQQNLWEVDPSVGPPLGITLEFWPPEQAELYFLDRFKKLTAAIAAENMRAAA
jgi:hypothetical protein